MVVHHLNCGSIRPYLPRVRGVIYCLLVETSAGLVLVDTGFGVEDYTNPTPLVRVFIRLLGMPRDFEETAVRQIVRLGFAPKDVTHIVMTHLHLDHAGGLRDFPDAQVHVFQPEYEAALNPRGFMERFYVSAHWAHGPNWVIHGPEEAKEEWFGFDAIRVLPDVSSQILLIPLVGHTRGHCGVAIETPSGWLFHCGDATSPFHPAADAHTPSDRTTPRWIRAFLGPHIPRLRQFAHDHTTRIRLISSHDAQRLANHQNLTDQTGPIPNP
jgi:glyoxylase-like metal-dependent hydrolase (beta-lactamase superfamily II)